MIYEQQKEAAGRFATFAWIGSGLYLYVSTEGAHLFSWHALAFFLVGMFVAAVVFGVAIYGLQRGISKMIVAFVGMPGPSIATAIRNLGIALYAAEAALIFMSASWVFHQLEPTLNAVPTEFREDRANFVAAMNQFMEANELNQRSMAERAVADIPAEDTAKMQGLIEKGLEDGRKVRPEFLSYLDPELPAHYRSQLLQGHELLLQGQRSGNRETQAFAIELLRRFYQEFWPAHQEAIVAKLAER